MKKSSRNESLPRDTDRLKVAGNLTILGSVANIIVVESARKHVEAGFWDYARYGIPMTVLTTVVGMIMLLVVS